MPSESPAPSQLSALPFMFNNHHEPRSSTCRRDHIFKWVVIKDKWTSAHHLQHKPRRTPSTAQEVISGTAENRYLWESGCPSSTDRLTLLKANLPASQQRGKKWNQMQTARRSGVGCCGCRTISAASQCLTLKKSLTAVNLASPNPDELIMLDKLLGRLQKFPPRKRWE